MIRFFICNLCISIIIGIFLAAKRIFKNTLSSRMQYNLWFILLGMLAVPFMPVRLTEMTGIWGNHSLLQTETIYNPAVSPSPSGPAL